METQRSYQGDCRLSNRRKLRTYGDLPLLIVWCQWMLIEWSLDQEWNRVLPNLLILFLQMALRSESILESHWGPGFREEFRSRSTPGHGNAAIQKQFEKPREAGTSSCYDKWGFDVDDDRFLCQGCQICSVRWTRQAKIHSAFEVASGSR